MVNVRPRIKRVIKFSRAQEQKKALICSAIKQLRPIEFYYQHGYRTVEPFALGIVLTDHEDNLSLLCWQINGFSDLNEIVGWKLYRVSDMEDIEVQNTHFTGIRPGYEPDALEMVQVICCVPKIEQAEVPALAPIPVEIPAPAPIAMPMIEPIQPIVFSVPEPPPPPPPPPQAQIRPIVRVLSHNQLMERFRYAHPQPLPELEDLVWQEPLTAPFPEPEVKPSQEPSVIEYLPEAPLIKIWPETPFSRLGLQPA
jgi:hypothetical protein